MFQTRALQFFLSNWEFDQNNISGTDTKSVELLSPDKDLHCKDKRVSPESLSW